MVSEKERERKQEIMLKRMKKRLIGLIARVGRKHSDQVFFRQEKFIMKR